MRFLIDEDVDVRIIPFLKRLGHDAKRVTLGLKNGAVIRAAIQDDRLLITRDADFTDGVRYPPSRCPGIIHLDIHPPYWEDIAPRRGSLLAEVPPERLRGRLVVVRPDGFEEFR